MSVQVLVRWGYTLNLQRYCDWRNATDDHGQIEYATASGNDYVSHEQTYQMFVTLTKTAVAVVAVVVILMWLFLT